MNCLQCSQDSLLPIWYGVPDGEKIWSSRNDKIVLGGPKEKSYTHFCISCQETYPSIEG